MFLYYDHTVNRGIDNGFRPTNLCYRVMMMSRFKVALFHFEQLAVKKNQRGDLPGTINMLCIGFPVIVVLLLEPVVWRRRPGEGGGVDY